MDTKIVYNGSRMESVNCDRQTLGIYDDITLSTNNTASILDLCSGIAQKIKEQVVDVIGRITVDSSWTPRTIHNELNACFCCIVLIKW